MITLTRLSGSAFVLNSDLIERIDSTPDTVVTLVDGKKYVVTETLAEIIDSVRTYRAHVIAVSALIAEEPVPGLHHDPEEDLRPAPSSAVADRPLATVAMLPSHGEA